MTSSSHTHSDCPDLALLEEYVLDRLEPAAIRGIETHLSGCDRCVKITRELKEEGDQLLEMLSVSRGESSGPCVSEEELALYMDRASDAEEYARIELHLAGCEACRVQLISLYTETTAVLSDVELPEPADNRPKFSAKSKDRSTGRPEAVEPPSNEAESTDIEVREEESPRRSKGRNP